MSAGTAATAGSAATAATAADPELFAQIATLVRRIADEDDGWPREIRPDTRVEGELFLDSMELAALDEALSERYGRGIDLADHIAGLDIDEIIALTVADVAAHVAAHVAVRQSSTQ